KSAAAELFSSLSHGDQIKFETAEGYVAWLYHRSEPPIGLKFLEVSASVDGKVATLVFQTQYPASSSHNPVVRQWSEKFLRSTSGWQFVIPKGVVEKMAGKR